MGFGNPVAMDRWSSDFGFQSPSFSAVLQEIYQQTQTEIIQARDHNMGLQSVPVDFQSAVQDDTFRYEPLMDPALSYISDILAEDDDAAAGSQPCMSFNEFVAYQAKAAEVAALLKEDSPSLTLQVEQQSPLSPDGAVTSISEESYLQNSHDTLASLSYLDIGTPSFTNSFYEPSRNEVLLNSLRGPGSGQQSFDFMQAQAEEVDSPEAPGSGQPSRREKAEIHDDFGARSPSLKSQRSQKTSKVLKARKESTSGRKKGIAKGRPSKDGDQELVDINDLLLQIAHAVGTSNNKRAMEILKKVKQYASPYGNGAQRLAYYFAEAMDARFSGTGWPLYLGLLHRRPSSAEVLKATCKYMASCPFVKAYHYFINQTILKTAKNASKLYILELQPTAFQYLSLFKDLAARLGGPPQVQLIAIGFPHYSTMPARTEVVWEGLQKTGRQLKEYAASCGVPFEYVPWAGLREDLQMLDFVSPHREPNEVLVVISASMLRYVMDDLDSPITRSKLLKQGWDTNPDVYIQGIVTGSYNTPYFPMRFKEALFHFESVFDMLDTFIEKENTDRLVFESEILGKAILNIVACEGTEIVERVDKYKHWQAVTVGVGFVQLPLDEDIKNNMQAMVKTWHKEYTVAEDSQYLLMAWKGRMLHAMSTWKASP